MSDSIRLEGVLCRCRIGVPAWERKKPQRILLDVAVEMPLRRAGLSDDLRHSPDYHGLERALRSAAEAGEFKLLEALAETLAKTALAFDERIVAVEIHARKKPAVMPKTGAVIVAIRRVRKN